jgi:hypothetical protein
MAYAEPTGAPEALPIWTSPANMARLEAIVERIQQLQDLHLAAHHVVNSFLRHNIAPLQQRSCPHWEVLSREHLTRLHQESPIAWLYTDTGVSAPPRLFGKWRG